MKKETLIAQGKAVLGIELGSTRIKAVLTTPDCEILATGIYDWENKFEHGYWTYAIDEAMHGLQACYADLTKNVKQTYGVPLTKLASFGVSAMMHGYLALDAQDNVLVPFRTWRNTTTGQAADILTEKLAYNIPQRWSIAHLYQAVLNKEEHLSQLSFMTTLSGYIHYKLTGEKVLGVGDASGMFPIDPTTHTYYADMLDQFASLVPEYSWDIHAVMPKVCVAGQDAGCLTQEGALLLDPTGALAAGVPMCAPEGDAGTGMVATNSVKVKTGNVSAGTSIFAMLVLEKALSKVYPEIDLVSTPSGDLVAMVHCNNCTSDLNAWVNLFQEALEGMGMVVDKNKLFKMLYTSALTADADCGGLLAYNYVSGEPITGMEDGRAVFARALNSKFNLANFMRTHLLSAVASLKVGMDLLEREEQVTVAGIVGHGGLFKTPVVGQQLMAAALNTPVSVMENAGEGGAWGIAVLASYLIGKKEGESLSDYLEGTAFKEVAQTVIAPVEQDVAGFATFMKRYMDGLAIERAAVETL